jgi:hypothetical protein
MAAMPLKLPLLPITALLAVGVAAPARADQVHFTGSTTVDAVVIRDALQNILRIAAANEQCNVLSAVEASVLPAGYRPPPAYAAAGAEARYERWDASLCGRVVPFLLSFWSPPEGGTMFQIGYPYPAEVPAAASRSN